MKKGLKYVIAAGVILVIAFLYAHIDKKIDIYDTAVDASYYGNMGELLAGQTVRQEFACERDVLDGVSIKCDTIGNPVTATYEYQIADEASGEVLRKGIMDGAEVKSGKYHTIDFEQISGCKGQNLVFTIVSQDAKSGDALTVYNVPKGEEKGSLHLNADEFPSNTLALRTVSHLFDLETFFGVAFCLAYLYIFIVILFKFFR